MDQWQHGPLPTRASPTAARVYSPRNRGLVDASWNGNAFADIFAAIDTVRLMELYPKTATSGIYTRLPELALRPAASASTADAADHPKIVSAAFHQARVRDVTRAMMDRFHTQLGLQLDLAREGSPRPLTSMRPPTSGAVNFADDVRNPAGSRAAANDSSLLAATLPKTSGAARSTVSAAQPPLTEPASFTVELAAQAEEDVAALQGFRLSRVRPLPAGAGHPARPQQTQRPLAQSSPTGVALPTVASARRPEPQPSLPSISVQRGPTVRPKGDQRAHSRVEAPDRPTSDASSRCVDAAANRAKVTGDPSAGTQRSGFLPVISAVPVQLAATNAGASSTSSPLRNTASGVPQRFAPEANTGRVHDAVVGSRSVRHEFTHYDPRATSMAAPGASVSPATVLVTGGTLLAANTPHENRQHGVASVTTDPTVASTPSRIQHDSPSEARAASSSAGGGRAAREAGTAAGAVGSTVLAAQQVSGFAGLQGGIAANPQNEPRSGARDPHSAIAPLTDEGERGPVSDRLRMLRAQLLAILARNPASGAQPTNTTRAIEAPGSSSPTVGTDFLAERHIKALRKQQERLEDILKRAAVKLVEANTADANETVDEEWEAYKRNMEADATSQRQAAQATRAAAQGAAGTPPAPSSEALELPPLQIGEATPTHGAMANARADVLARIKAALGDSALGEPPALETEAAGKKRRHRHRHRSDSQGDTRDEARRGRSSKHRSRRYHPDGTPVEGGDADNGVGGLLIQGTAAESRSTEQAGTSGHDNSRQGRKARPSTAHSTPTTPGSHSLRPQGPQSTRHKKWWGPGAELGASLNSKPDTADITAPFDDGTDEDENAALDEKVDLGRRRAIHIPEERRVLRVGEKLAAFYRQACERRSGAASFLRAQADEVVEAGVATRVAAEQEAYDEDVAQELPKEISKRAKYRAKLNVLEEELDTIVTDCRTLRDGDDGDCTRDDVVRRWVEAGMSADSDAEEAGGDSGDDTAAGNEKKASTAAAGIAADDEEERRGAAFLKELEDIETMKDLTDVQQSSIGLQVDIVVKREDTVGTNMDPKDPMSAPNQVVAALYRNEQALFRTLDNLAVAVANVAEFFKALEVDLTCRACLATLSQPRSLLGCGHSFCAECVNGMFIGLEAIQCAECTHVSHAGYAPNPTVEAITAQWHARGAGREHTIQYELQQLRDAIDDAEAEVMSAYGTLREVPTADGARRPEGGPRQRRKTIAGKLMGGGDKFNLANIRDVIIHARVMVDDSYVDAL
jgi:hypothetical protein